MNEGVPTPCHGHARLFSSTNSEAHALAAQLCARCPIIEDCRVLASRTDFKEGTWAGVLYRTRPFTTPAVRAPRASDPTLF